ncbi:MAG: hypothetical protein ACLR7U_10390 [Ruthenibacterium lactatiformans]
MQKVYYAVAEGLVDGRRAPSTRPLRWRTGPSFSGACGRAAQPHGIPGAGTGRRHTLLRVVPITGAHIRSVHFASGHPLAGDSMYGGCPEHMARPALHCGEVSLACRGGCGARSARAPLPEDMRACGIRAKISAFDPFRVLIQM